MKSFKQYIIESEQSELSHVMSGPLYDGAGDDSVEHAYHASIPSDTSQSGHTNLWISHVVRPKGSMMYPAKHHELHFTVSDSLTPDTFHARRTELESHEAHDMREKAKTPSEVAYSIPSEKENQVSTKYHGPATMMHIMRHMHGILERIPQGDTILVSADSATPEDTQRKTNAYMAMARRGEKMGLVKAHPFFGSILMVRS